MNILNYYAVNNMRITFDDVRQLNIKDFLEVDIIDLRKVEYMHSAYIGLLAEAYKKNKFKILYPDIYEANLLKRLILWIESKK